MKTLEKRIEKKLTRKDGEIKVCYQSITDIILNPTSKFRLHSWSISKSFSSLKNENGDLIGALRLVGVDFEYGNDAPRGGKNGDYIKLTKKGVKQTAYYRNILIERKAKANAEWAAKTEAMYEAKRQEHKQKIEDIHNQFSNVEGLSEKEILTKFFANFCHPAPKVVYDIKNKSGLSWKELQKSL